jgi:hypothetical protein
MMAADPALATAFRPFERRAMLVEFARALTVSLLLVALAAEVAIAFGARSVLIAPALAVAAVLLSGSYAIRRRPTTLALARRVDERARLNDLLVTAVDCAGDGMPALVRTSAIAALGRESAPRAFPFEWPLHWRRWLIVAALVQVIVLPTVFRDPASRAAQSGLSALALPAGSAEPQKMPGESAKPGADTTQAQPSPAVAPSSAAATSRAALPTSTNPGAPDAIAAGASGAGDRLRLAAASADAEIAAGRVPLARRALVRRYFAAMQPQRKQPR